MRRWVFEMTPLNVSWDILEEINKYFCRNGKKRLDWFGKIWEGKRREIGGDDVNMFEGGGGSCCIWSIYNYPSLSLSSLLSANLVV